MKTLRLADGFRIPESGVTTSFALLAMKGAGKSNAAVVFAERLFEAGIPWVAIDPKGDWWGIRAGEHGLPVPIFGGLHADIPLDPTAGTLVADLIVREHLTALIDTSEFTKADSIRFLTAFFDRLYRLKSKQLYPMHLFLEEADDYVPQKVYAEISRLVRQVELVVKRGRSRGLGITLATQRAASVNKDVLTQTDVLVALRSTSPQDRKAIKEWLSWHASSDEIAADLPTLQNGEAWVSWPEQGLLERVKFDRRRSFDSGATPELGEKVRPATLADIDVEAITAAFKAQIEQAEADDPRALRAELAAVRALLEDERASAAEPEIVEVVPPEVVEALEVTLRTYDVALEAMGKARAWVQSALDGLAPGSRVRPAGARSDAVASPERASRKLPPPVESVDTNDDVAVAGTALKAGARRMLTTLQNFDRPLTKQQLSVLAQVTKGGTFSDYLSTLRQGGYIVEDGDTIRVAPAHRTGSNGRLPTPEAIADLYRSRLKAGARRMLDVLMTQYPHDVTRTELSEKADVTKGGTFSDYLASLTRVGLAETHGQHVRAGATLYIARS